MRSLIFSLSLIGCLLTLSACGDEEPDVIACDFDLAALAQNVQSNQITPGYSELADEAKKLADAVSEMTGGTTEAELEAAREAWRKTASAYQTVSPFGQFGPAAELFTSLGPDYTLETRLNTYPPNIELIEDNIENSRFGDVDALFKSQVGLPALGYLLWGHPDSAASALEAFAAEPRRATYAEALALDISTKSEAVAILWTDGNTVANNFAAEPGNDAGGALSLLVNSFNYDFETLKNFKFRLPLGRLNTGDPIPSNLEAYYAGYSLELARAQLEALESVYRGGTGSGFDDYLRCLEAGEEDGQLLADDIEAQFAAIKTQLDALNAPLREALVTNTSQVDEAYLEMQQLVPLIKREMTSAFGVRISYADNDGD